MEKQDKQWQLDMIKALSYLYHQTKSPAVARFIMVFTEDYK